MASIFITGATSGIGKATALAYAKQSSDHQFILLGRRTERLEALANEIGSERCHLIALDIRDSEALTNAIETLPTPYNKVDILVNNAGLALGLEPAHKASLDDWQRMVDTNITSLMTLTRLILPSMVERNHGHIINLGSMAGTYPYPGGNVYGATKAFVEQFSLNLRADLIGTHIRVTNMEPGMTETEFSEVRFHGDKDKSDNLYNSHEALQAEDIARAIIWVTNQPAHMNVNRMEIMPTCQAPAGLTAAPKK